MKQLATLTLLAAALAGPLGAQENQPPAAAQPAAVQPEGAQPAGAQPAVAQPAAAQPAAVQPAAVPPEGAQPAVAQPAAAQEESPAEQPVDPDLTAILRAIDSYVAAFNQADAKALAAHWTPAGQFVQPSGDVLQGRQQLEEGFTAYFAESKQARLELVETNVRLLSPSVAVETGIARVILPELEPSETDYEAIHVKTAEGWKIDSVREQEAPQPPPSSYDKLQELEWMLGRWVDADENAVIETTCRWSTNRNFLIRSFRVFVEDRVDFEGTQVIGWDASAQIIRSWTFDSDGGFGVGRWSGGDSRWTVQSLNVLADGKRASATQIYERVDENTVRFSSIGRQVDGELLPNIDPVLVVRADE